MKKKFVELNIIKEIIKSVNIYDIQYILNA